MKVYQVHFEYGGGADDGLYYGGSDSEIFSSREKAQKCLDDALEARKIAEEEASKDEEWPFVDDNSYPIGGCIIEHEIH
jgi:hypothetical protein